MTLITRQDLKSFQEKAVGELAGLMLEFPSPRFQRFDPDQEPYFPFFAGCVQLLAQVRHRS